MERERSTGGFGPLDDGEMAWLGNCQEHHVKQSTCSIENIIKFN